MSDREHLIAKQVKPTFAQQIQSAYDRMIGQLSISDMIRVRIDMIRNWLRGFRLRITGTPIIVHQHVLNKLPDQAQEEVRNIEKALSQHPEAEKHFGEIVVRHPQAENVPKLPKYNVGENVFGMNPAYNLRADPGEGSNNNPMHHHRSIEAENPKKVKTPPAPVKKGWFNLNLPVFFKKNEEIVPIDDGVDNPLMGDRIDSDRRYDSLLRSLNNSTVNKKSFNGLRPSERRKRILSLAQKKIEATLPTLVAYNSLENREAIDKNDLRQMKQQRNAQLYDNARGFYRKPESAKRSLDKRKKNKTRIARVIKALGEKSNSTRKKYLKRLHRENEFSFKMKNKWNGD
jgi:hypothetical protein